MPHQRKYVPSHSGGTASQPSRAKRWMSAYASQGLSSRLSLSTRCAFVSFTASLMDASRNAKAGERSRFSARPPGLYLWLRRRLTTQSCHPTYRIVGVTRTYALHRAHLAVTRPVGGSHRKAGSWTCMLIPPPMEWKIPILDRDCQERL